MSKDSKFEDMARDAAARILQSSEMAEQLTLLPGLGDAEDAAARPRGRGVAKRNKGLGVWLRANGYQDPGERLAELANLNTTLDPITAAIARCEQAAVGLGITDPAQKLGLFQTMFAAQMRALEALAPYVHAKASPDAPPPPAVVVHMNQGGSVQPGDGARLVNPAPAASGLGVSFAPPPMPAESKQNQEDTE